MTTDQLIIGTDEAGYGPNLGPLVITATAWRIPADVPVSELWERLAAVICRERRTDDPRLHVADSKQVYAPATGLHALERSVLSFLGLLHNTLPQTVREFGRLTSSAEFCADYDADPCRLNEPTPVPLAITADEADALCRGLRRHFHEAGITLLDVRSQILLPPEFNQRCTRTGSKGRVLSQATLDLVGRMLTAFPERGSAAVFCDKHGGRNRYDELIADILDGAFVFRVQESRACSHYRVADMEFRFRTRAEELLPVALASLFAKYTREILMAEFNAFWTQRLPTVRPTRGYPVDAARFREQIATTAKSLGISESRYWRQR